MRLIAVFLCLTMIAPAQMRSNLVSPSHSDFSAPWFGTGNYWKKNFGALDTRVVLEPPVRLAEYVVDGKLTLSLKAYLDLVLANNTNIGIQKLTLEIPKNGIQRALGVFDPTFTANFSATRSETPATNELEGANIVSTLNQPFTARVQQLLPTSTTVFGQWSGSRQSSNNQFLLFNPGWNNTLQMGFTQPLLRGRGMNITRLPITIAKRQVRVQEFTFRDQVQNLIVQAENAYWDLVSARERLRVQEQALSLAEESLKRARRELELGATPELEIYQPEQQAATARIGVVQVQYQIKQFEDSLRRQIGADLDPAFQSIPIVLTEDVSQAPDDREYSPNEMVDLAKQNRPDLMSLRTSLEVNDLQIESAMNQLKPQLNFQGTYSTTGRGGTARLRPGQPGYPAGSTGVVIIPGGLGDAFNQWFNFNTFAFSLNLQLPLRDRAASAGLADAVVNKRLNAMRERNIEQQLRQEVLNAITQVESSREGVKLARIALEFAEKRVEADQKRYDLGVIQIFFLLSAQTDLTQAQSNLVNQTVQYKRNLLVLQQRLGTLLEDKGLVLQ
ncbi:MAG: TolC family protein [Bryobacteraceae bacterium]|nr:TolC family protein [Solibacteraceae bacterium]MCO5351274.1 TolC family protein [Bryobacteraceae bacterium]